MNYLKIAEIPTYLNNVSGKSGYSDISQKPVVKLHFFRHLSLMLNLSQSLNIGMY